MSLLHPTHPKEALICLISTSTTRSSTMRHYHALTTISLVYRAMPNSTKQFSTNSCHISMAWIISQFLQRLQPDTQGFNPHVSTPQASPTMHNSRLRVMQRPSSTSGQWSILQMGLPLRNSSRSCSVSLFLAYNLIFFPLPYSLSESLQIETNLTTIEQERLPFLEGWRPPTQVTNGFAMAEDVMLLALATPEKSLYFNEIPPAGSNSTTYDVPVCYNKQCSNQQRRSTIFG